MKILPNVTLAAIAAMVLSPEAKAQSRAQYESMVATHASANNVPEALVHRVIVRESKYHPNLVGRGGTIGLMQIKLPTARGLGYTGDAAGLRDPDTNLAWGTKYLAGAYRAANGDHSRAVRYYASGYYYAAKRQRQDSPCRSRRCWRATRAENRRRRRLDANAMQTRSSDRVSRARCSARALLRRTGTQLLPAGPGAAHRYALRCVRGTNAVQFRARPR